MKNHYRKYMQLVGMVIVGTMSIVYSQGLRVRRVSIEGPVSPACKSTPSYPALQGPVSPVSKMPVTVEKKQ